VRHFVQSVKIFIQQSTMETRGFLSAKGMSIEVPKARVSRRRGVEFGEGCPFPTRGCPLPKFFVILELKIASFAAF